MDFRDRKWRIEPAFPLLPGERGGLSNVPLVGVFEAAVVEARAGLLLPLLRVRDGFVGAGGSIGSRSLARTGGRLVPFVRGSRGVKVGSCRAV